ncbi:hypothetical protein QIH87_50170 (plasmid) [Bradyrhizobium elkanii]|uniref:hypothetical protein n=1 Tax=Bradyrhizobium elkanii TaxID=29448 RepID=UPI002714EEC6|nr:hypothetical protein [Bradyrhizobium elkanii]WLA80342.1 hypothetical protein QNJ99_33900 [Bradyrhizobium elkanii]WLB14799.1 hypothetical protein QIH87_50170 [Bradyrhizobium elkanii]WLB69110.1 hypothetical protein QIH89_27750 [Bradyrhizobium elkanii]
MSREESKPKWDQSKTVLGWTCPECGDHYFNHTIRQGRPVCGTPPLDPPTAWVEAKEEIDAGWPDKDGVA